MTKSLREASRAAYFDQTILEAGKFDQEMQDIDFTSSFRRSRCRIGKLLKISREMKWLYESIQFDGFFSGHTINYGLKPNKISKKFLKMKIISSLADQKRLIFTYFGYVSLISFTKKYVFH